ncbi:MAG: substrate-binding domain-containing protein [Acidimicrobiales bacterium]
MSEIRKGVLFRRLQALLAVLLVTALIAGACGDDDDDTSSADDGSASSDDGSTDGGPLPTSELCGTEPIRLAHIDGFGGNAWRQITHAELLDEISDCDNIEVSYAEAGGDLQAYSAAINSFVAQGYDVIVTYDDFGNQALGSLRDAFEAGVVVVPYTSDPNGVVGEDYSDFITMDYAAIAEDWAAWMADVAGDDAELIFVGGIPGNPSSLAAKGNFEAAVESLGVGLEFLNEEPIDTNWNMADAQQALAGAITQYTDFEGWVSDYGVVSVGGIRAMENAGRSIPPLATYATSNELGCVWYELSEDNPDFELFAVDGTTRVVRLAVRKALAALNGLPDTDVEVFVLEPFMDTVNGIDPPCEPDLPPDADLSSGLSPEQLAAVFES